MSNILLSTFALLILMSLVFNSGVESRNLIFEGSGDMCFLGCPKMLSPVCGSNGRTYSNECRLIQDRECNGFRLKKQHDGRCKKSFPISISEYTKQQLRKRRLCNGNRLTACSLMGGLCVKTYKGNDFICQLNKADRLFALNIAI